jgi:hypothetical protein
MPAEPVSTRAFHTPFEAPQEHMSNTSNNPSHTSTDLDAALALAAENICESLLEFDWAAWRAQLKDDTASLKDLISVLARLSREVLAREKYREELAAEQAQKETRPPTPQDIRGRERDLKIK